MAFHTSCPITCKAVCHCTFGTPHNLTSPQAASQFLKQVVSLAQFWGKQQECIHVLPTVEVLVPRVEQLPVEPKGHGNGRPAVGIKDDSTFAVYGGGRLTLGDLDRGKQDVDSDNFVATGTLLRTKAQKSKSSALLKAQEEAAALAEIAADPNKILCEICRKGEPKDSPRASRMLPCRSCKKKFHTTCVKSWASNRESFDWSDWVCTNCRNCEVCRKPCEFSTSMFCHDCDKSYHCYCVSPPLKAPPKGPFLCPSHTKCHSCASLAPGTGTSSRWFLSYTLCDACGRLFVKNKYCTVCLKVYRDTEPTPMVCCDSCEHWVHIQCDNISEEMYDRYQSDQQLSYKCPCCTGKAHKIRDLSDAAKQLWKRRMQRVREERKAEKADAGKEDEEQQKKTKKAPPPDDTDGEEEESSLPLEEIAAPDSPAVSRKRVEKSSSFAGRVRGLKGMKKKRKWAGLVEGEAEQKADEGEGSLNAEESEKKVGKIVLKASQKGETDASGGASKEGVTEKKKGFRKRKVDKQEGAEESTLEPEEGDEGRGAEGHIKKKQKKSGEEPSLVRLKVLGASSMKGKRSKTGNKAETPVERGYEKKKKKSSADKDTQLPGTLDEKTLEVVGGKEKAEEQSKADVASGTLEAPSETGVTDLDNRRKRKPNILLKDMDTTTPTRKSRSVMREMVALVKDAKEGELERVISASQGETTKESTEDSTERPGGQDEETWTALKRPGKAQRSEQVLVPKGIRLKVKLRNVQQSSERHSKDTSMSKTSDKKNRTEKDTDSERARQTKGEAAGVVKSSAKGMRTKRKLAQGEAGGQGKEEEQDVETQGKNAMNRRVEVYWPDDKTWYQGVLLDVEPVRRKFVVLYDDGQQELLHFGNEKIRFVPNS